MNADLMEKIGVLVAKADAAHSRIDKMEILLREDLGEIKNELKGLSEYMHRGKGWNAAIVALVGAVAALIGAGIGKILELLTKH